MPPRRYFSGNVEISFSKAVRMQYDSTGIVESRSNTHDRRLLYSGMMETNKKDISIFPFTFTPMHKIAKEHNVPEGGAYRGHH